jgi:methyl-accepting chemotaxis protein
MDSLTSFAKNASSTLNASAGSLESMGGAVGSLASSLASVPYMPEGALGPLQSAADELEGTAQGMRGTAASMANASDNALSTASGVQSLKEDIGDSIASMEDTKRQIDEMQRNAKIGLVLGSVLAVLMFALNSLSFYRQLKDGAGRG